MSFWRYQMLRLLVGLPLLIVLMFVTHIALGYPTLIVSSRVAVLIAIPAWLAITIIGTYFIAKGLRRRWGY